MQKEGKSNVRALADARMEMRLSPQDKALINQAASLSGTNATAFVLASALAEARRLLGDSASVQLSAADYTALRALLATPPTPPAQLTDALERHRGLDGALAGLFQRLDPSHHELDAFDGGADEVNEFLHRHAATQERLNLARVYVLTDALAPKRVLGYYTLAAVTLTLPRGDAQFDVAAVPALRLSRLALDRSLHGRGLGALLLADAIARCAEAADALPVYALIAATRDEREDAWFEGYGFRALDSHALIRVLPLAALE